jgi:hypothetical protein
MLDELCALTGWSRRHAIRALAQTIHPPKRSERTPRPRLYAPEVLGPLRVVWATLNGPAGKRLAPFMAEIVSALERCGELEHTPEVRDKLLRISAATIDRLLAPERARLRVKGPAGNQAGQHPQTADPHQNLRRVERGPSRVLRDGPGGPRRR